MKWSRKELKQVAKGALPGNYWKTIFISFALLVFNQGTTFSAAQSTITEIPGTISSISDNLNRSTRVNIRVVVILVVLTFGLTLAFAFVKVLAAVFLKNPMEIGAGRFLLRTNEHVWRMREVDETGLAKEDVEREEIENKGEIMDLLYYFDHGYMNVIKTEFIGDVYIFLWSLLLVIPGIIKSYEYRMVPFILAESPTMETREVLELSRNIMYGNKWQAFLLDMSFIPWHILGVVTLGIGEILYVNPYTNLTDACLYRKLKEIYTEKEAQA